MNEQMVIFLLSFFVLVLASIVVWQHLAFRFGIQRELLEMAEELKDILDRDSGAGLMIFTNHQGLMALMSQINRLLEKHRKARAGYCRSDFPPEIGRFIQSQYGFPAYASRLNL